MSEPRKKVLGVALSGYHRLTGDDIPYWLRPDAPTAVCSVCGRHTVAREEFGRECGMTQPDGHRCRGTFGQGVVERPPMWPPTITFDYDGPEPPEGSVLAGGVMVASHTAGTWWLNGVKGDLDWDGARAANPVWTVLRWGR